MRCATASMVMRPSCCSPIRGSQMVGDRAGSLELVTSLGLEAQRHAVCEYVKHVSSELLAEFVEIESGSRNDRPQLKAAIDLCKKHRATLIIAKLDRLARNVAFISTLMESGISFLAADNPHANKLMIHMLAAFAEHERDQIRAR